jgi:hypothetical protein
MKRLLVNELITIQECIKDFICHIIQTIPDFTPLTYCNICYICEIDYMNIHELQLIIDMVYNKLLINHFQLIKKEGSIKQTYKHLSKMIKNSNKKSNKKSSSNSDSNSYSD